MFTKIQDMLLDREFNGERADVKDLTEVRAAFDSI
jgi:hypothetical protein